MTELRMRIWQDDSPRGFVVGWNTEDADRDTLSKEMIDTATLTIDFELDKVFGKEEE